MAVTALPVAPANTIGGLCESERELEERFELEMMPALKLSNPRRRYRPKGTGDIIDVYCVDQQKRSVAVEFKLGGGQRKAVEQLLRYIAHLRHEGKKVPRGILITGEADIHTWRALQGLDRSDLIEWWYYGIQPDGSLAFRKVPIVPPPPAPDVDDIKREQERILAEIVAEQGSQGHACSFGSTQEMR